MVDQKTTKNIAINHNINSKHFMQTEYYGTTNALNHKKWKRFLAKCINSQRSLIQQSTQSTE